MMKFPIPAYIFLGLFVVASIIQLVLAFTENQRLRRKQKFSCMLCLGIAAVFAFPTEPLIYIGAFLGMLGDILVLRKSTFVAGSAVFFFGHICYLLEVIIRICGVDNLKPWMFMIFAGTYLVIFSVVYLICNRNKTHTMVDKMGQALYFAILVTYIPVLICAYLSVGGYIYLSLIGAGLFIISDTILVVCHFGQKFKRYDFYIMLSYLLAELLIISGFVLTLIK